MAYMNRMELMGNLGKDPELRYLPDSTPTATVSLAYSEKWRDKTTQEMRERTEWFSVVLYGRQAETVCRHMRKGDCLFVCGKMQSRRFTDRNGAERTVFELIANECQIIHTKPKEQAQTFSDGIHAHL